MDAFGYDQCDGVHYESVNIAYPVTDYMSITIVLMLKIIATRTTNNIYVKGDLLNEGFTDN